MTYHSLLKSSKKVLLLSLLIVAELASQVRAQNQYGIPTEIQDGNILHCFNWKMSDVKAELPNIAAAGFGAVQLSPLQRNAAVGDNWSDIYRPYDFKFTASGLGTAEDLKSLCAEAATYGIKVVVDVVANHVDGYGAGDHSLYHDPWWNSNNRLRWLGSVNYGDRYSITHNQMGGGDGYPDVNSEDSEVAERAKSYIEELRSYGVKGIRWDAAKHIALPSEECGFWTTVMSVTGLYHYGEVLDNPGGSNSDNLMKEYTNYMSVTDNGYSASARNNDGTPGSFAGWAQGTLADNKVVYWGESHDTYSNDNGESKYTSQEQIDRAYAILACRNGATALYFSRPSATSFNDIKVGAKGSTHFTEKQIAEVNKFRNAMVGKADWYSTENGVSSVTRKDGGAVIVKKGGGGNVSIANGGGYCPSGTYTDHISGGTFTVTSTTISGTVGASGIAVIYGEIVKEPSVTLNPDGGTFTETQTVTATLSNATSGWYKIDDGAQQPLTGTATFTIGSGMAVGESVTVSWSATDGTDTRTGSATYTKADKPDVYVRFNNTSNWSNVYVWAWNDDYDNLTGAEKWPGDKLTQDADGLYTWTLPAKYDGQMPSQIIFSDGNDNKAGGGDLPYENGKTYKGDGTTDTGGSTGGDYPATLYLIGTLNNWNTSTPIAATGNNGVYTWNDINMTDAGGNDAGKTYFTFITKKGETSSDWDTGVNQADRYGASSKDAPISAGGSATIRKFAVGVDASAAYSWQTTPGTYTVTANLATNVVTLSNTTAIGNVSANNGNVKVYTSGGRLYIDSPKAQDIVISTASGISTRRKVNAGINVVDGLAHGIYVINNIKVVL